jgi:hypothetical protein
LYALSKTNKITKRKIIVIYEDLLDKEKRESFLNKLKQYYEKINICLSLRNNDNHKL